MYIPSRNGGDSKVNIMCKGTALASLHFEVAVVLHIYCITCPFGNNGSGHISTSKQAMYEIHC